MPFEYYYENIPIEMCTSSPNAEVGCNSKFRALTRSRFFFAVPAAMRHLLTKTFDVCSLKFYTQFSCV